MKILEKMQAFKDSLLNIAKTAQTGDADAIADAVAQADTDLDTVIADVQAEPDTTPNADDAPATTADGEGDGDWDGTDLDKTELVEVKLTKTQAQELKKFVDMYISGDDLLKLLEMLKGVNLQELVKTVEANKQAIDSLSAGESKQIIKTAGDNKGNMWSNLLVDSD